MAEGKLKSNTDEMWNFFSDLNKALYHLDNECDEYRRKMRYMEQRLDEKVRDLEEQIESLNSEISVLKNSRNDDNADEMTMRIAFLQGQISLLEDRIIRIRRYLEKMTELMEILSKRQMGYQNAIRDGKKIINKYLSMVEKSIAQKEVADYQKKTTGGRYHVMNYRGTAFYGDDDAFDPVAVDEDGRTNIQRMEQGKAPLGRDGQPIELHHMIQSEKIGGIVEVSGSVHRKNHRVLHINTSNIPSGINRANFSTLRKAYWKRRAEFMKRGVV